MVKTIEELRSTIDYDKLIASTSPALQLYIRSLEQENARLRQENAELRQRAERSRRASAAREQRAESAPASVETTRHAAEMMAVTITDEGQCKRTPLNAYSAQRRGGVGVFDILIGRDESASQLLVTRAGAQLLFLTDQARAFRVAIDTLPLTEVRGRGTSLPDRLLLEEGETLSAVLAFDDEADTGRYLLIATVQGWVHRLRGNYVGSRLQPGSPLYDPRQGGGVPVALTLSGGDGDVLLALRSGLGIRFAESLIRRGGVPGIQIQGDDAVASLSPVPDGGQVLLVSAEGKGIRREMDGFRAHKSPGGRGKILMKTEDLVGAAAVGEADEVLCLSQQAKVIRFAAAEVSTTTGSVQGNSLMDCRGSCLAAFAVVPPPA